MTYSERNPLSDSAETTADTMHYCGIDEMQGACQRNGWSVEFRQLEPGVLAVSTASRDCADISLLDQSFSQRTEIVGEAPQGHITVLAPVGRGKFSINGQSFDGPGIFLLQPRAELQAANKEILRVVAMTVPISLLRETGRGDWHTWQPSDRCQTLLIEPGARIVQRLRLLMEATLVQPTSAYDQVERASSLATILATIVGQHSGTQKTTLRTSPTEGLQILRRAREYIEAHLSETIPIRDVCTVSATSLSKLERTFQRELQMSPSRYILTCRLEAVRKELGKSSSADMQIAHVAMDHGFNHLGRFAGSYREQFGELPSQTVRHI
jgi:AraC-like DNA-binding protein